MSEIPKIYRDGKVAVLYSPENDGGWYTWNEADPRMLYDPFVVCWVLDGKLDSERPNLELRLQDLYGPRVFLGGLESIEIEWLPEGTIFYIEDISGDGYEQIVAKDVDYHVA